MEECMMRLYLAKPNVMPVLLKKFCVFFIVFGCLCTLFGCSTKHQTSLHEDLNWERPPAQLSVLFEGRLYQAERVPSSAGIRKLALIQVGVIESVVSEYQLPVENNQSNQEYLQDCPIFTAVSDKFDYSDYLFVQNPDGTYTAYKVYQLSDGGT